jgi:hypothetical protein
MKSPAEIEQALEQLGQQWPPECSLVEGVQRRIESNVTRIEPKHAGFPVIKWLLATAASLVVLAAAWRAFHGDNTLYAQAIDAIRRARTVCITMTAQAEADKPPQIVRRAWYERGVGFREELGTEQVGAEFPAGEIRLGNQNNLWTYLRGSNLVIRAKSGALDDLVDRMLDIDALKQLQQTGKVDRYPAADQDVDGQPCRAYLYTYVYPAGYPLELEKGPKRRSVFLFDDQSRMVRVLNETQSSNGWKIEATIDWKYDVPVERTLFQPNFGNNVKIVDADQVFDQFVDLDKALYREERAGLWFAIHRLQRFQDGIFIVSSVRGTDETLKKYPLKRQVLGPGMLFDEGPAANYEASPQGDRYFRIDLARADFHGINVCWWVLVPRGVPLNRFDIAPNMVKLPVGITPHGNFAKNNFSKNGVIQHLTWDIVLNLPEAVVLPSVGAMAAEVYADQTALEVLPFRRLDMGSKDNVEQFSTTEKTTAMEYASAVASNIQSWRDIDVEFQLEGQFASGIQGNDEAIGLAYEPTVNDATLTRVAKRESLKRLYLDGTKITDAGLRKLAGLKELRELSLAHTSITDNGLKELESVSSLRELNVKDTQVSGEEIARLKTAIPELKVEQ